MPKSPRRRFSPPASHPNSVPHFSVHQRQLTTKRRGELAELAFTLKAASHGFGVAKPFGDSERYDVIVDSRPLVPAPGKKCRPDCPSLPKPPLWRVQIKSTMHLVEGFYHLDAQRRSGSHALPYLPGEIDFLAAYIFPDDVWYIIPLEAIMGRSSLLFRRCDDPRPSRYHQFKEAWHLLRPG